MGHILRLPPAVMPRAHDATVSMPMITGLSGLNAIHGSKRCVSACRQPIVAVRAGRHIASQCHSDYYCPLMADFDLMIRRPNVTVNCRTSVSHDPSPERPSELTLHPAVLLRTV